MGTPVEPLRRRWHNVLPGTATRSPRRHGQLAVTQGLLLMKGKRRMSSRLRTSSGCTLARVAGPVIRRVVIGVVQVLLQQLQLEGVPVGAGLGFQASSQ